MRIPCHSVVVGNGRNHIEARGMPDQKVTKDQWFRSNRQSPNNDFRGLKRGPVAYRQTLPFAQKEKAAGSIGSLGWNG